MDSPRLVFLLRTTGALSTGEVRHYHNWEPPSRPRLNLTPSPTSPTGLTAEPAAPSGRGWARLSRLRNVLF